MAFSLALVVLLCLFLDWLLAKVGIPTLIGMLFGPVLVPSLLAIGSDPRMIALLVIPLRSGLDLLKESLNKVGRQAILLSFLPALCETLTVMLIGPFLLGLSQMESAILGCVPGAVSPAVVVPMMATFIAASVKEAGFGGFLLILIALVGRSLGTCLCTLNSGFTVQQKIFIIISYLPKATVQAAIGSTPRMIMSMHGMPAKAGRIILAVAVMSIVMTAPMGAIALNWAGKHLLTIDTSDHIRCLEAVKESQHKGAAT